jgi:hypothetical protein
MQAARLAGLISIATASVTLADTKDTRSDDDREREKQAALAMVDKDPALTRARRASLHRLGAAIVARDASAVAAHVQLPVKLVNIQFDTEPCRTSFGGTSTVEKATLAAFVECIASLEIATSPDKLSHGPGFEIVPAFDGSVVTALVSTDRISGYWLWRHQLTRKPFPLDTRARELVKRDRFVGAMVDICVDDTGKVATVTLVAHTDGSAAWAKRAVATIRTWKYVPVRSRKTSSAVSVCAREVFSHPRELRWNAAVKLGYERPGDYFMERDEDTFIDPYAHEVRESRQ